jgi:antitoxin YefM
MKVFTYTAARKNLASVADGVCENGSSVAITRSTKNQSVVVLSLDDYHQLQETALLLGSPANAKRLLSSVKELSRG